MERAQLASVLARGGWSTASAHPRTLISERDPAAFRSAFCSAVAGGGEVFLCNPAWESSERRELEVLLQKFPAQPREHGWLMIPTGGTSGGLKFARHDHETVTAAIAGFTEHFGIRHVNVVNVLPLYHVSGLMAWLRSAVTGGEHVAAGWISVAEGKYPPLAPVADGWVISLVPTQLERLLAMPDAVRWLLGFRAIFVGGGPSWSGLLERARVAKLPIAPTFGMTETAAMVAGLRPREAALDVHDCGLPMPHARIKIDADGAIVIAGPSVFRGYFPEWDATREFTSPDAGEITAGGRLRVLGRRDGVIISGGEKVQPLEVEEQLRATGEFGDVAVIGRPHPQWGQEVVVCYAKGKVPNLDRVEAVMRALAPYKRPKAFLLVDPWPVSEHGKLNRAKLAAAVAK